MTNENGIEIQNIHDGKVQWYIGNWQKKSMSQNLVHIDELRGKSGKQFIRFGVARKRGTISLPVRRRINQLQILIYQRPRKTNEGTEMAKTTMNTL